MYNVINPETKKEMQEMIKAGKTAKEIVMKLGTAYSTTERYVRNYRNSAQNNIVERIEILCDEGKEISDISRITGLNLKETTKLVKAYKNKEAQKNEEAEKILEGIEKEIEKNKKNTKEGKCIIEFVENTVGKLAEEIAEEIAEENSTITVNMPIEKNYKSLFDVFMNAYEQAAEGKGKERHASNEAYEHQKICTLNRQLGSNHGAIFQACKKAIESTRLDRERAKAELLGSINYLAAAYILLDEVKND